MKREPDRNRRNQCVFKPENKPTSDEPNPLCTLSVIIGRHPFQLVRSKFCPLTVLPPTILQFSKSPPKLKVVTTLIPMQQKQSNSSSQPEQPAPAPALGAPGHAASACPGPAPEAQGIRSKDSATATPASCQDSSIFFVASSSDCSQGCGVLQLCSKKETERQWCIQPGWVNLLKNASWLLKNEA